MFKTFTAALLAASASAANEGNNFDNIVAYTLIPDKLKLHLYNAYDAKNVTHELHGELIWADDADENGFYSSNAREMGFCVRAIDTTFWDCMRTRFSVDPEEKTARDEFTIVDGFSNNGPYGFTADAEQVAVMGTSWVANRARSSMVGCVANDEVTYQTACTSVKSVWARNFDTFSDQDLKLGDSRGESYREEDMTDAEFEALVESDDAEHFAALDASAETVFEAVGWLSNWTDSTYKDGTEANRVDAAAPVEIQLVFPAYVAAVKAGTAEADNATTPDSDDELEDESEDDSDDENMDDGATAVTTAAASVMAAIFALTF